MPVTRSSARLATSASAQAATSEVRESVQKRSAVTKKKAKKNVKKEDEIPSPTFSQLAILKASDAEDESELVPAVLTFNYEEAKKHLIGVDHRFEALFRKMKCKPFEHLDHVHPFHALTTSILGQQISWLAARSITQRFLRLYEPSLPEKPTDEERRLNTFFPTPRQVMSTDLAMLRTAGLSGRKAEYVQDLASRFADGRLSTDKLLQANDEELAEMLTQVRGIGRWTVDMFAIFSLRRPDILPVGDLGVQRGLLRWFLALHSPGHTFSISPHKIGGSKEEEADDDELPSVSNGEGTAMNTPTSSILPDSSRRTDEINIPPTFSPSIKKVLQISDPNVAIPLPPDIDVGLMKSRLKGKKIKGAFLTPLEMASLTESWKPFRSVGVYYMWSLAES